MVKRSRRVEISIELNRLLVQRGGGQAWCVACQMRTPFLTVDEAALLLQVDSRTVFHYVEARVLHSMDTSQGLLRVCLKSLLLL
jgi:hypothetical protein